MVKIEQTHDVFIYCWLSWIKDYTPLPVLILYYCLFNIRFVETCLIGIYIYKNYYVYIYHIYYKSFINMYKYINIYIIYIYILYIIYITFILYIIYSIFYIYIYIINIYMTAIYNLRLWVVFHGLFSSVVFQHLKNNSKRLVVDT